VLPQGVPHVSHVDHARIGADRRVHCYQSITNTIV
jgi:hypothetical protein